MSTLTIVLCIWAMLALCAVLFIRGASPRVERTAKPTRSRTSSYSVAE